MLLKRFYDTNLAQASYLLGCAATGEALVIDANRDIDQYVEAATAEGMRITHVTETHIHADFVSGSRELAHRTSATLLLSDEGGEAWTYTFAGSAGAVLLHDGDSFMVGNLRIDVLHTPGHTPEHLSFMVTDTPATSRPIGVFTGDFIFVGDVGRPDLLERAAGFEGTMVAGARTLFRSIERFKHRPDYLQLWPGHGAGSACGKSLGAVPSTTLGYEKIANWGLSIDDEDAFIVAVLADQPEPPVYFARMKQINREGPRLLNGFLRPEHFPAGRLSALLEAGATIIDTRPALAYAQVHVPGTINIPFTKSFTTWAGWLAPYDGPLYLIGGDDAHVIDEAVKALAMIGLDRVAGYFGSDLLTTLPVRALASIPQVAPADVAAQLRDDEAIVIDVRGRSEWDAGHLAGVRHIPLGYLADGVRDVPRATPIIVHCQSGARSAIAASVLEAQGFTSVANLDGGYARWVGDGRPVDRAPQPREGEPAPLGSARTG